MNSVIPYLQGHKVFRLTAVSTAVVNCNHLRISDVFPDEYIAFQNTILHFTQLSKGAFYSDKEITVQSTPLSWEGMHYCDLQKILPPLIFPEPWEWVTVIFTRRHRKRGEVTWPHQGFWLSEIKTLLSSQHCNMWDAVTCHVSKFRSQGSCCNSRVPMFWWQWWSFQCFRFSPDYWVQSSFIILLYTIPKLFLLCHASRRQEIYL